MSNSIYQHNASACDQGFYGDNCQETCQCSVLHSSYCQTTDGACTCKTGWTGSTCTEDVNECMDQSKYDCPTNARCVNSIGSFLCNCFEGFQSTVEGNCEGMCYYFVKWSRYYELYININ